MAGARLLVVSGLVSARALSLSLGRRPKWGVCGWRAHRSIASAGFLFFLPSGEGESGGEGSQDVSSLKKRDHRDNLVQGVGLMVVTSECDSMVWLNIGSQLHLRLEILPVAPTELGSDLHPTPRFSGRCGNAPRTTYIDCPSSTSHCRNVSDNRNKRYIVDSVAEVNQGTTRRDRVWVAFAPHKIELLLYG